MNSTAFARHTNSKSRPFVPVSPQEVTTGVLLKKTGYHMKQVLACLLELKKRDIPVCDMLSRNFIQYDECIVKYNDNSLCMYVSLKGKKNKIKK